MQVIVTEKKSVADTYAEIHGAFEEKDGYMTNGDYVITWCRGHLVTLSYPEKYDEHLKKWELETLPFLPEQYKYEVIASVKKQFNIIKKLYNSRGVERIYYAGDSAREGLYIQMLVRQLAGHNPNAEERVVWIDSQTEEEIFKGIRDAKPLSEYTNKSKAGYMRAIEDYAVGINFSRAFSVKYASLLNYAAGMQKPVPISVGRVMTCVLGMIVTKELEIKNFKPTSYYRIKNELEFQGIPLMAEWHVTEDSIMKDSPLLYSENGFKEKQDALHFMSTLPSTVSIKNVEKKLEKKNAPLLFNLAELQNECSKRFKLSPDETLGIAQSLYEKKLTTYPRTDARVLSSAVAVEINKNITGLSKYKSDQDISALAAEILKNHWYQDIVKSKYVNDSQIEDHYALIPTGDHIQHISSLSDIEYKVFDLICRRFLSIFFPPAEYMKVQISELAAKEEFIASGKFLSKEGYLKVIGVQKEDGNKKNSVMTLGSLKKGDVYPVQYKMEESITTPPKRYTSGSIILAMENAGKLIEDEELRSMIKKNGIGTSATRAEIIKKLIHLSYISLNSKTQVLTPANMGYMVYTIINEILPEFLNPTMTASWEKGLNGIEQGTVTYDTYMAKMEDYVRRSIAKIKASDISDSLKEHIRIYAKNKNFEAITNFKPVQLDLCCPLCGSPLQTDMFQTIPVYKCSSYKKEPRNCSFILRQEICSVQLGQKYLHQLITSGETDVIKNLKNKKGKKFEARLRLNKIIDEDSGEQKMNLDFVFPELPDPVESNITCPKCQSKKLMKELWKYTCSCGYSINHVIASRKMKDEEMQLLIKNGKTGLLRGFKSKKGRSFKAVVVVDDDGNTSFEF